MIDIRELLNKMTVKEKVGQLVQVTPSFFEEVEGTGIITGLMGDYELKDGDIYEVGSVLGSYDRDEIISIQKEYLKKNRLGIPLIFMADVIHGIHTIFPIPLGLGSSFDPSVVEQMASLSAKECQRSGVHLTFSPMVDLMRDPRWGRVMEGTGEDNLLNSELGRAFIRGYQGKPGEFEKNYEKIAACVKHFVGYGAVEGGREYNSVSVDRLSLFQDYLPSFRAAIEEGVAMVMTSFNTVNGIPSTGNRYLLTDVLRGDLDFKGPVIADWGAVGQLVSHGVAEGKKEAAKQALISGCDIDMMTNCYYEYLEELVSNDEVLLQQLDSAVLRVLQLKKDLGLFEDPYRGAYDKVDDFILGEEIQASALEISKKSIVLLKNDHELLPLNPIENIALIGPKASSKDVLGAWLGFGKQEHAISLQEGMASLFSNLTVVPIASVHKTTKQELLEAVKIAKKVDKVILALGEESDESGEGASKGNITLSNSQLELIRTIHEVNPKIITVLFNGRPLDLREIDKYSSSILETWFLGTQAGSAIAEILVGRGTPEGKLPMSFPYSVGQIPVYYNHMNTGNPLTEERKNEKYISRYLDTPNEPLYPFGYGLSYTSFELSNDVELINTSIDDFLVKIAVTISNTGKFDGSEVIQIYLRDKVGQVVRPVKELIRFKKVHLAKGKSQTLNFELTKNDLLYYNSELNLVADEGAFDLFIGTDSQAPKVVEFVVTN